MNNWFYMDRLTFKNLLVDELGPNLTQLLLQLDFDSPIAFLIGHTSEEILKGIQQTMSRQFCRKLICSDHCATCSLNPPVYAKLTWFTQRLLMMNPLSQPFIKQSSSSAIGNLIGTTSCGSNEQYRENTSDINSNKKKLNENTINDLLNWGFIAMLIFMMIMVIILPLVLS